MRSTKSISALVGLLLAACSSAHEVSRVVVPGTSLTIVLYQDEKMMYSYRLYSGSEPVSDERLLGPHHNATTPTAVVSYEPDVVTTTWPGKHTSHFVKIDIKHLSVVEDSNESDTPPAIKVKN